MQDGEVNKSLSDRNKSIASQYFYCMIMARLSIFHAFLELVSGLPGGLQNKHKGQWLLLQLASPDLVQEDIFAVLTREVLGWNATLNVMQRAVVPLMRSIRKYLNNEDIILAFDEAQITTRNGFEYFQSTSLPAIRRPFTGTLISVAKLVSPNIVFAGTGMSLAVMKAVSSSAVAREDHRAAYIKDLGWFDDAKAQQGYIALYCPPALLNAPAWEAVWGRASLWLRGRYVGGFSPKHNYVYCTHRRRFTATFISRLLQSGFKSPHRIVNDLVLQMSGIRPSDADHLVGQEPEIHTLPCEVLSFNFDRIDRSMS
jgi:hypothetical protein